PDSILLWGNGKLYIKSEAAIWSTASLGGIWIIVRILFIFPKFLRNMVYDFVARNRYKWFQKQSCMLPDDNFKDRFV
ncbi:MAG TPA: DCC1-like thiol-disulfide oxidoreductase family protein, partial [Saprospiraceae bacterium]|nr:DCC1-like thiol-disulfide oxidoreductase family protein [Saprospiraceae bacterium]